MEVFLLNESVDESSVSEGKEVRKGEDFVCEKEQHPL